MTTAPQPQGSLEDTPRGRELAILRTFPVRIDAVWAALTTTEGLEPWIGRIEGDPASGKVTFFMTAEGEDVEPEQCTITECTPLRSFSVDTAVGEGAWHLSVALEEAQDGTRLRFAQLLGADDPAGSVGPGWEYYLDRLGAHLSGGDVSGIVWDDYYPSMSSYYEALGHSTGS